MGLEKAARWHWETMTCDWESYRWGPFSCVILGRSLYLLEARLQNNPQKGSIMTKVIDRLEFKALVYHL